MKMIEYAGWKKHFETHPPGMVGVEILLAQVLVGLCQFGGGEGAKILDFAPWLEKYVAPPGQTRPPADPLASYIHAVNSQRGAE